MRKYATALVCLFIGCAAGSAMPTITAQTFGANPSAQRWEQFCDFDAPSTPLREERYNEWLRQRGAEGWEMFGFIDGRIPCFKRPAAQ
jgi:hypothetical protein